jgi:hypothetical protein
MRGIRSKHVSAALEERAHLQEREGASISRSFNIPHIAKSLMPVDNEPTWGEPFRRWYAKAT